MNTPMTTTPEEALVGKAYVAANTRQASGEKFPPYTAGNSIGQIHLSNWSDNPYAEGSEDWKEWRKGFQASRTLLHE